MKKILISLICLLVVVVCRAQFSITQNLGSPNTLVKNPNYGGFQGGLIPFTFADTTAANLTNLKYYAGAYIYTTSPRATWWRDAAVSTWVQVLPGGGSGSLSAWTTTLNTAIPTDLSLNGYFGTTAANGIGFYTSNTQRLILPAGGLTFNQLVSDTTANKVLTYNTSTKELGYGYWYGGGSGATPTYQQTLTAGSTLTQSNTITAGVHPQIYNWAELTGAAITIGINNPSAQGATGLIITNAGNDGTTERGITVTASNSGITASNQAGYFSAINGSQAIGILASASGATSNAAIFTTAGDVRLNQTSGDMHVGLAGTNTGKINLGGSTSGTITIQPQAAAGTWTMTLPTTDGNSGEFLQTDGNGVTSWAAATGGANTALSNLASVAINTSLISDANNTDDLGSNTIGWRYGYISSGIGIGGGFTTPSAALDIRAADLFLTSSSVDQRFIIGESLVSATDVYAISWNRTDNQLVFNEGGAAVSMRLEGDNNANLFFADATNDRIGIGDATPASLFTVGSGDLFQVNTSGDMVKIKNVTYSWPAANASGVLTNNGSGTLSWTAAFALTNGVGTTANGTAVDLGGTVNSNVAIDEDGGNDISFDIGRNTAFSDIRMGALNFTFNGGPVQMNNYGAGAATFDASGNITSVSDMRLKNLQGMYEVGLKQLMQINPIVYKWNEKSKLETKHDYIGFSAQNVRDALGENAIGINKDGYYSLQDRAILAAMVNSIKELKELNDKQQEEINNLKSDIRNIKKQ